MEQRLQKIIADAGITSRRKAEQIILEGRVSVNGKPVSKLGSKADLEKDHIRVDGRLLGRTTEYVYLLLNKPVGYVSTVKDPEGRPTVMSLVKGVRQRVYPVGRLDFHSSGLMILTNDGELANFLMARSSAIPRSYQVKLEGRPDPDGIAKLQTGIVLDGRRTEPCQIRALGQDEKPWFEITLIEGRYHQVRRMFERVGKGVVKLKRVRIAFLTDQGLDPGKVRHLTRAEVERLKNWKASDIAAIRSQEPVVRRRESELRSQHPVVKTQPSIVRPTNPGARSQESGARPEISRAGRRYPGPRPQTPAGTRPSPGPRPQGPRAGNEYDRPRYQRPESGDRKFGPRPQGFGAKGKPFGASPRGPETGSPYRGPKGQGPASGSQKFGSKPQGFGTKGKPFGGSPRGPETGSPYRGPKVQGPASGSQKFGSRPQRTGPKGKAFGSMPQGLGAKGKSFGSRPQKPDDRNRL